MFDFFYSARGRFSRGQWWLAHFLIVPLVLIGCVPMLMLGPSYRGFGNLVATLYNIWMLPTCLSLFVCANIKRFHDRGKSGWWWLIAFIPVIGSLWHFIESGFLAGEPNTNIYGPPPGAEPQPNYQPSKELDLVRANLETLIASRKIAATQDAKRAAPAQLHDRPRDKQTFFSR
jgi:uncharacterized membrane protein YhaH (DUF805 family)